MNEQDKLEATIQILAPLGADVINREIVIPINFGPTFGHFYCHKEYHEYLMFFSGPSGELLELDGSLDDSIAPKELSIWICESIYEFLDKQRQAFFSCAVITNDFHLANHYTRYLEDLSGDIEELLNEIK